MSTKALHFVILGDESIRFANCCFPTSSTKYTYLTRDTTLKPGDFAWVLARGELKIVEVSEVVENVQLRDNVEYTFLGGKIDTAQNEKDIADLHAKVKQTADFIAKTERQNAQRALIEANPGLAQLLGFKQPEAAPVLECRDECQDTTER